MIADNIGGREHFSALLLQSRMGPNSAHGLSRSDPIVLTSSSGTWRTDVLEPMARPVAASLARRLRELRQSGFPARRLTQAELAVALSHEYRIGASAVAGWENIRRPTLPGRDRLRAYAQFFATVRSMEPVPYLVPLTELRLVSTGGSN
jgi:hypothetical protein